MILMWVEKVKGDCLIPGFKDHFTLESFSFGIAREIADSAKAGTADIVFGVGELQEVSINKSMDFASPDLAKFAMRGATVGTIDIKFVETTTDASSQNPVNIIFLYMRLDKAFIKTWNVSGDADGRPTEDMTLWYNKIVFKWFQSPDGQKLTGSATFSWDHTTNREWPSADSSFSSSDKILIKAQS